MAAAPAGAVTSWSPGRGAEADASGPAAQATDAHAAEAAGPVHEASSRPVNSATALNDGASTDVASVNQPPTFPATTDTRSVDENIAAGQPIGDAFAATDPEGGSLSYSLGGPDAGTFAIDRLSGQLRTKGALDHEAKSEYDVTVIATDPAALTAELQVTITVTNVDEPGTVTFFPVQPRVWTTLRATLTDPDGRLRSVTWEWQRSQDRVHWTRLTGVGASYIPASTHAGMYIRALASYRDGHGANKSAEVVSSHVVAAREAAPNITVVDVVTGLDIPWDLTFTPDGTILFTQRAGVLSARLADGTVQEVTADLSDLYVVEEAGFMAIVVDPDFATNRRFYTCQNDSESSAQVVSWTIDEGYTSATRADDPLVGGIPAARRHSGCRLLFGPDGYLWIATGDGSSGTAPQDLTSLGGKVLRVDASTGAAAPGNPFGTRVYTYGHRNPQGLARRPNTNEIWAVEHGPAIDDEINLLTAGGNYGWNPVPDYNQKVPMTDLGEFPDAIEAKWSSGDPTLATAGGVFLHGADWKQWNGRMAVATLKEVSLRIFQFDSNGAFVSQVFVPDLYITYGRLRTPLLGPDGALYLTTSSGSSDRIIKVVPSLRPAFTAATAENSVPENNRPSTVVATVSATDPESRPLTYTLSGADAEFFSLVSTSGGQVRADTSFDYEARDSYEIMVTASDPYGLTDSITVTVSVTDVDEPPEVTGQAEVTIEENSTTTVGTYTASDPEGGDSTWLNLTGADARYFEFDDLTSQLSFIDTPDYDRETNGNHDETYDVILRASDAGNRVGTLAVTVTLTDVNEEPLIEGDTVIDLDEVVRPSPGQVVRVATYRKRDPERSATNWGAVGSRTALSGADADAFEFDQPTGRLTFASPPDFEDGGGSYQVTLSANDGVLSSHLDITVNVANVDERDTHPVQLDAQRGVINVPLTATLTDPDNVLSATWQWQRSTSRTGVWTDIAGTNSRAYTPTGDDRGQYLRATVVYEDGHGAGKSADATTEFTTRNECVSNTPPVLPDTLDDITIPEDTPPGRNVGSRIRATDSENDPLVYSLSGATEFVIGRTTSQIRVAAAATFDYDQGRRNYVLTVTAADGCGGSVDTVGVTIRVTDVNEAPVATGDAPTLDEDGSIEIDVLANDRDPEDGVLSLVSSLPSRPRRGSATVDTTTNRITYTPRADYHGADSFTYRVQDDGSPRRSSTATVSITIRPVNDAPTFGAATAQRSVAESAGEGDPVGDPVTATDVDTADVLTYRLSGADAFAFEIDDDGQITVASGVTFDASTQDTYTLTVAADDGNGGTASVDVTITVTARPTRAPAIFGGGGGGPPPGPEPSDEDFEWTVIRDIEALDDGHGSPTGMWSDGTTLWLADNAAGAGDAVYAYDLAGGARLEAREFALHEQNRAPRGVWSDGETIWVSDSGQDRLFAHDLASGARLEAREFELARRNRDARGIWSDGETMWVLDGGKDGLFAYELESGEFITEYALAEVNNDPHGIWSDGTTVWVSNHDPKRLYAYRLPVAEAPEGAEQPEIADLERAPGEDFKELSTAGNNSPRGIWSDGDAMYVADPNDGKVYSYNMPDAIDARLASLTLTAIDIGAFDPGRVDYQGAIGGGVTETVVTAEAMQRRAEVAIDPPDADRDESNGHQAALAGVRAITVTVTSADGTRQNVYRVSLEPAEDEPWPHCLRGDIAVGFSLVLYEGGSVEELAACAQSRDVATLYTLHEGVYVAYILGAPDFVNRRFRELYADGVPALTTLVAGSTGPPSDDPVGELSAPRSWPHCLRGEIADGFSLVLYEGGSVEELAACAQGLGVTAVYALTDGEWVSFIPGAPGVVNRTFRELFHDGVPAVVPLLVSSERLPGAGSGEGGEASD